MKHLDLFSGIGGFALAARWMGWQTVQFVEIEPFCQAVLKKNFPNTPIHGDIKTFDGTKLWGTIDIITGGFPCQPFSTAGSQEGTEDHRHLWPEMFRVIREIQPTYVVAENVYGILNIESGVVFETVCAQMEDAGYEVQPIIIPACAIGAQIRRDRVWFIGSLSKSSRIRQSFNKELQKGQQYNSGRETQCIIDPLYSVSESHYLRGESIINGGINGLPTELDKNRLTAHGNAIVPQVAFEIFKAIDQIKP
jgi:DNA-cytosine methyltransferase